MGMLYELAKEYRNLLGLLDEAPEEAERIYAEIEALDEDVSDKAEAYARIIQSKELEAEMYGSEIKRLQGLKARAEKTVERLRGNLVAAMDTVGASKIMTSIGTWALRKNPPSVRILDEKQIPEAYRIPQPSKIDKKAIQAAFKNDGEIVPGTEIVQEKRVDFS